MILWSCLSANKSRTTISNTEVFHSEWCAFISKEDPRLSTKHIKAALWSFLVNKQNVLFSQNKSTSSQENLNGIGARY